MDRHNGGGRHQNSLDYYDAFSYPFLNAQKNFDRAYHVHRWTDKQTRLTSLITWHLWFFDRIRAEKNRLFMVS